MQSSTLPICNCSIHNFFFCAHLFYFTHFESRVVLTTRICNHIKMDLFDEYIGTKKKIKWGWMYGRTGYFGLVIILNTKQKCQPSLFQVLKPPSPVAMLNLNFVCLFFSLLHGCTCLLTCLLFSFYS